MRIAFNPSTVAALTSPPNNKDITFDLRGQNIFARGVKFYGTDTNTWRDIKVNNVSIGSHTLDLRNGSNTTLTNTNGVVTINSTWRPVVDSLTSDSTTSSLSAKQGKVLKGLLDGKSNTGHTHDDRYLRLSGGTMNSDALITFADSGSWGTDKGPQGARGGLRWTGQSDSIKLYAEETAADNLDLVIQFGDDNSNGLSIRNKTNTQTSYISASGVITTGTFKGNLDWSYITNKPATATRWPSWAEVTGKPSSFTPSTHTHGLSNSVFFLNMPSISGNAKWKEVFGYPVNYNLLLSVRINSPAPEWCVGNYGSGILYGGSDTKGFMSSAYNEPLIMWAGGNGSSDDSVPKWYIGIRGTHKSIYNLTTIASEANAAYNLRHSHANKSVLDGITSGLVSNWNTAYTFVHTITGTDTDKVINKWDEIVNFLAGIDSNNKLNTLLNSKLSVYELADKTNVGAIKNNGIYYSTTDASSSTLTNSPFSNGFALINMTSYDGGDDLRRSRLAFNAYGEIKVSDDRGQSNTAETWYNVLTSKNSGISGSTIKLNGTSITVYSSGTADGRYVKKSGDTMTGVLTIDTTNFGTLTIKRNDDANGASIQFRGKSSVYGYIGLNNSTKDKQFLRWNSDISKVYTILDTSSTYTSSGKGVINGTTITQVDNATNATNSTNARKLVNWYSSRPTSLNAQFGDGSLRIFYATSSTTEGKPAEDSHILHLAWDNTGGWDAQLAVHIRSGKVSTRAQSSGTWQPWKTLAFTTDIPSSLKNPHSFNVFGVTYDGSAAKTVTTSTFISQVNEAASTITDGTMLITSYASNSGFADTNAVNIPYKRKAVHLWEYIKTKTDSLYTVIGHTHDDRYLRLIGGTMTGTINRRSGGSTISGRDHAIIRQTYAPGGSSWNPIACVDTETGTWTLGHLSSGDSDTNFHFCFSTNADYNAGNNNGNYVTLRNRAGIIALTSEIPNKNSWNYDDRYYTKAESNAKYITDISTSVNKLTFTKNGSNIDRTITVNNVQSLGRRSPLTERNAISGIYTYGTYSKENNLAPTSYFETLGFGEGTAGAIEIGGSWISGGQLYWRALRDCCENWFSWKTILDSSNYSDILDSRYYTESEVNSLLSNKLNTSDFNWTNLPGKIVAGNEFNIVNAGFKESMWFNYLPINDRNKTATISSYHFGNGAKGYASVQASGFIKSGGNVSQLLRADGGVAAFNWSGQSGQPTWLWGGNSQHSYYVYNPSNFRVAYAASAGNADTLDGEHANSFVRAGAIDTDKTDLNALDTYSFIKSVNSEVADHSPKRNTGWYNVIQLVHRNGSGDGPGYIGQIALGMTTNTDDMFFRGKRTDSWKTVIHSGNISSQTVASATKLQTARNIALGTDLRGSANFDGSSNIIINANINACTIGVGSTNGLPFKRIAHFETGSSWNDNALLLYISQGYINGSNGICRVEFRTDNISSSNSNPNASSSVRWLVRNGYNLDSLYAGYYVTTGKAYIDIYLKTTGGYQGTVIRVLQDSRGGINSNVQLINSHYYSDTNHKEAYNSVEAASTALYNRAYTRIVSGSDVGTVSHANSAGSVNWNNITGKPSSLPANGGNADTVDGVHMDWSTNYTEGNYLAIWDNKGNCIRPIPKGSTSVGYASSAGNASTLGGTSLGGLFTAFGNNAHNITATIGGVTKSFLVNWAADSDKLDGKHASDFATAGHNHDGRYLKLSGGTLTGGIEIQGTISGSNYASSEGFYTNKHNSLILRGDATYGKSGILFTSSKGTNSINQTSDKGFIQFQSYGGTNTTGEENKLVIGVGNDSTDMVYIQTPSVTGLKHVVGTNPYTIWDSGNLTKLSQLTNDKGFVTGSVNGKTITINGTSTTWSNTWRPISDDYEKGDASTSLSTLGSLTLYNDLLSAIPTIPTIPNPTNYYWANIKVSSSSSTTTSPTVNVLTATRVCAGHDPGISNSISCSNWFRSSGETGWYSSTYGGGWYMSDKDWIRSWGSKALYINNSIRSTNYQVMYGSTSASAARLESTTTLVYGTDTSSNSINSYLRGTTVTLQVKKGTSINHNALQLTADYIYCNNYCDMKQGAVVSGGNFTVNNNSYLAQSAGAKVGIGTSSPSYTLDVRDNKMRAGGYVHFGYSSDDAVLLAGGGYAQGVPVKYWSIEFIQIFNSKLAERTTSPKGNYTFITKIEPYIDGSCKLTLQFPSGYNRDNTMIWAMGILRQGANYGDASIYATIVHSSGSEYHLNLADDATLNNGTCQLYFMCF